MKGEGGRDKKVIKNSFYSKKEETYDLLTLEGT
jgi:hypothetical protein